jgi:hypothetical protein
MSNKYKPHLQVLLEDDANRQIFSGFEKNSAIRGRVIERLPLAGGWAKALTQAVSRETFLSLQAYPQRRLLIVIDFDERTAEQRLRKLISELDTQIKNRVYVLSVFSTPEGLKSDLGHPSLESIGQALAQSCIDNTPFEQSLWAHELLKHNESELARLRTDVKSFLFT